MPKQQNIPAIPAKAFLHLTLRLKPVPSTLQFNIDQGPTCPFLGKASLTLEWDNLELIEYPWVNFLVFFFNYYRAFLFVSLISQKV